MLYKSNDFFFIISIACDCEPDGTTDGGDCDKETDEENDTVAGQCHCKENIDGIRCDKCKNGYWNFTVENPLGCQGKQLFCHNNPTILLF